MKKIKLLLVLFLISFSVSYSQISIFAGYGQSQFGKDFYGEGVNFDDAAYIPVGASYQFGVGLFKIGVEVNYSAVPYTYNIQYLGVDAADLTISQLAFGGYLKYRFSMLKVIVPYIRGGGEYVTGKAKIEWKGEYTSLGSEFEEDYKGAFGFNLGGGVEFNLGVVGIYGEFLYHFVDRELDVEGATKDSYNNYAFHVGLFFGM